MKVAKEFEVEFDAMLTASSGEKTNLMTIGRTASTGQKTAIWVEGDPAMVSVTHNDYVCNVTDGIDLDEWKNFKIAQFPSEDSENYIFALQIDGATVCQYENAHAVEVPMADLLFSDCDSNAAPATVKNVRFQSQNCPDGQEFDGTRCKGF